MSLIHGALASVAQNDVFKSALKEIVDLTTVAITRSWSYTDLQRGRRRLNSLRAVLELDDDLRLRLDTYELLADYESRGLAHLPDASRAFIEGLEQAVKQRGSLVVVMPPAEKDPVVSLSFNSAGADVDSPSPPRASEPPPPASGAKADATGSESVSAHFRHAKYPKTDQLPQESTAWLARRIADVIKATSSHHRAKAIAVVPGRQHPSLAVSWGAR